MKKQKKVLSIRPGITDMASLRYKDENDIAWKSRKSRRILYKCYYAR